MFTAYWQTSFSFANVYKLVYMKKIVSENTPKVLIVGPMPPAIGGIATYISDILGSNLSETFELIPFRTNRPAYHSSLSSQNYYTIFNVSFIYLLKALFITLYHIIKFPIILITKKPSIIHINTAGYWAFLESSVYVLLSKLFLKKVIFHIHANSFDSYYLNSSYLMKLFIKNVLNISDKVIVLSNYWKTFFINKIGLSEDNICIVHNAILFSKFQSKETKKNISSKNVNVLFLGGTDAKRKGVYDILKSIPLVINNYPEVKFILISKNEIKNIKAICKDLGIEKNVQVLDQIEDENKISLLHAVDIYILPSYSEGLPISILEAMASGLPIISTTVGSIPEVITNGVNGFLIEPGDYKALAERISELIIDNSLRDKMRLNNEAKVKNNYDLSILVRDLNRLYSQV